MIRRSEPARVSNRGEEEVLISRMNWDIEQITAPDSFFWSTGIEDTFITAPYAKTGRTLDEYELTQHYEQWKDDIQLIASLGVPCARYGIPWHRLNPKRGKWDWKWADKPLEHLLRLGVDPIVDLVHYGLPAWIEGAFDSPDYPEYVAEYAARVASRFKGRIHAYTPLNEPRVTAWYCGKLGWWPPHLKGWRGFLRVLLQVSKGIVLTVDALRRADSSTVPVHVDATDLYLAEDPSLQEEIAKRQSIVFLALDLISGRVHEQHSLWDWLLKNGISETELLWFQEHQAKMPLIGLNMYPMFSRKVLSRSASGLRMRMPYAEAGIVQDLCKLYWERYQKPVFISEIASVGSVKRRMAWLHDSIAAVKCARENGVPVVGYTWWPLFALVTWAYRQGTHAPDYYLKQMGLWDLVSSKDKQLLRVRTPLVETYMEYISAGATTVGRLSMKEELAYVS